MAVATDIGTLITQTPEIHGGRPHIAGTGVTVQRVVVWYKMGLTPEEIEAADRILALMQEQGYTSAQEIAEAFARGRVSLPAALADAMGLNPRTA